MGALRRPAVRYDLAGPQGTLHVFNFHLASPHLAFQSLLDGEPLAEHTLVNHLAVRTEQSRILSEAAKASGDGVILAGDFNTPPDEDLSRLAAHRRFVFDRRLGSGHTYFGEKAAVGWITS